MRERVVCRVWVLLHLLFLALLLAPPRAHGWEAASFSFPSSSSSSSSSGGLLGRARHSGDGGGGGYTRNTDAGAVLYTPSGAAVSATLVRSLVPSASRRDLQRLLFEHAADGTLLSRHVTIDVRRVAPHVHVPDVSTTRVVIDGVRQPSASRGPTMRFGRNHTFVYDYRSNVLLAAWGPGLHLRPLHLERHPNIFVNLRHDKSLKTLHLPLVPSTPLSPNSARKPPYKSHPVSHDLHHTTTARQSASAPVHAEFQQQWRVTELNYRPNFTAESEIFFDVAFAFDAAYCNKFAKQADNVSQVVHAAGVAAHKMALGPVVSVRIGDIIGSCDEATDAFRRPPSVMACRPDSQTCSRPGLILEAFRKSWPGGGVADATYLISGVEEGSDVVGAAWIAAACNPDYGFGWIEGDYPVIIAHEISHSLGAQHSKTGLMRPVLDLDKPAYLTPVSLTQIQVYLQRIAPLNCLLPRHDSTSQNRRRYLAFTRLTLSNITEGTDVAILPTMNLNVATIIMLDVRRTLYYGDYLAFSFASLRRNPNDKSFPFSVRNDVEPNFFITQNVTYSHPAGGAVAVAKIIDKIYNDIVVVYLRAGYFNYVVGHRINRAKGILGNWMKVPRVPINLGPNIHCFGATISSLSDNSTNSANTTNDMVIAYIDNGGGNSRPYYIIGLDIGADGMAKRWTQPQWLQWETTNEIGDIGVDLIDTTRSGRPDLVFSHTERINGVWAYRITVGYDVNLLGSPTQAWKSITPDLTYSSTSEVEKITGGIALLNMGSSRPTATIYQGRQIKGGNTQWIEVGDDILDEEPGNAPPTIAVVDEATPLDTCKECYTPTTGLPQCEERIRECFAQRPPPNISSLTSKHPLSWRVRTIDTSAQLSLSSTTRTGQVSKPNTPTIFCAGFYDLFLSSDSSCKSDVQRVDIVTRGAASALAEDITSVEVSNNLTQANDVVFVNTTYGKIPEYLKYLSPGGASGNSRVPKTVQVYFNSGAATRQQVIRKALQRFRNRKDFSDLFSGASFRVVKNGKYTYLVVIGFNDKFIESFLKKLPP